MTKEFNASREPSSGVSAAAETPPLINSRQIVEDIWSELGGRSGIGDALYSCDDDIQEEIKDKLDDIVVAALSRQPVEASEAVTWRHLKRGMLYTEIGRAELQQAGQFGPVEGDTLVIYQGGDGQLWARAQSEFEDGRFERVRPVERSEVAERFQDSKFRFENGRVINRWSGEAVPQDEPVMVFRARDCHALGAISAYMDMIHDPHHKEVVYARYKQFEDFAAEHPERMKEPVSALHPSPENGAASSACETAPDASPASGMNPENQEPVAWLVKSTQPDREYTAFTAPEDIAAIRRQGREMIPLFTHPQREWKPISEATDDMITAGIDFALKSAVSSENPWPDYIAGLYRAMLSAAPHKEG